MLFPRSTVLCSGSGLACKLRADGRFLAIVTPIKSLSKSGVHALCLMVYSSSPLDESSRHDTGLIGDLGTRTHTVFKKGIYVTMSRLDSVDNSNLASAKSHIKYLQRKCPSNKSQKAIYSSRSAERNMSNVPIRSIVIQKPPLSQASCNSPSEMKAPPEGAKYPH